MPVLLALAEFVDKLQAVCHRCGGAGDTHATADPRRAGAVLGRHGAIGALDSYEARCAECFEPGVDAALSA